MKAKLELAISFLSGMINQASVVLETVLANHLKHVGEYADPVARAERLLDGLRQYAGPVAQAQLVQRLAVLEVLKELLAQVESDPANELSYEFSVGRQGEDYVEGRDVTVVTYGRMVRECMKAAEEAAAEGVEAEVIDMRSLYPYDWARIKESVGRTHRVIYVNEETEVTNFGEHLIRRTIDELF